MFITRNIYNVASYYGIMHHGRYGHLVLTFIVTGILLVSGSSRVLSLFPDGGDDDTDGISITCHFSSPVISSHDGAARVTMSDLPATAQAGHPSLPVKPVRLLLPPGHTVSTIDVTCSDAAIAATGIDLPTAGPQVPLGSTSHGQAARPPVTTREVYPARPYHTAGVQSYRGYPILTVQLHPVRYGAASGTLSYHTDMTVTVTTTSAGEPSTLYRGSPSDTSRVRDMVDNPGMLQQYPLHGGGQRTTDTPSYDYVIITSETLKNMQGNHTLQDLAASKTAQGLNATIVTVQNITGTPAYWNATPMFNDTQAQIRAFIRHAYLEWDTEYVLLAGDGDTGTPVIPARKLYATAEGAPASGDGYTGSIPSDVYYACLDGNWNQDQDDRWGENATGNAQGQDEADLYAEVYIGRAPVDNPTEVANFVRKTLAYQQTNHTYLERVLLPGEYLGFGGVADYGGAYLDQLIDGSTAHGYTTTGIPDAEYNITTLYDRDWPGFDITSPYTSGWPTSALTGIINNGVHVINHFGHGSITTAMKMTMSDVNALTNTHYPFIYSQTCLAGAFDSDDCFAEQLIGSAHGAFAAVMNTRQGWGAYNSTDGASHRYNRAFWDAVYNDSLIRLGRALQNAREDNVWRINEDCMRWCYYEITLFGDPAIALQTPPPDTEQPVVADVEAAPEVQEQGQPVNITARVSDNRMVADVVLSVTAPDGTVTNLSMQHGTDDTYYRSVTHDLVGNYSYTVCASDSSGNIDTSAGRGFRIVEVRQVFHFEQGWNVFTIPVQANYTAKALGAALPGCTIVAAYDASDECFLTYLVNVSPPQYSYAIEPGHGYMVHLTSPVTFTVCGDAPVHISIAMEPGFNLVGWCNASDTTAQGFGGSIDNCTIVSKWDAATQSFTSFVMGISPPSHNFPIERGTAVFVETDTSGVWHGGCP